MDGGEIIGNDGEMIEKIKNHQIVEEYTQHQNMSRAGESDDWEIELATISNL